jgi:LysM repeat protein
MHTVESGETLATIGKRYRTAPATIAAINKIQSLSPAVGDRLLIPAAYRETAPTKLATAKRTHGRRTTVNQKTVAQRRRPTAKGHVKRAAAFHQASGKLAQAGAQ